jgi:hypothetical protein
LIVKLNKKTRILGAVFALFMIAFIAVGATAGTRGLFGAQDDTVLLKPGKEIPGYKYVSDDLYKAINHKVPEVAAAYSRMYTAGYWPHRRYDTDRYGYVRGAFVRIGRVFTGEPPYSIFWLNPETRKAWPVTQHGRPL